MGVKDIFDPYENIAGGTQYLSKMLGMFNDNLTWPWRPTTPPGQC